MTNGICRASCRRCIDFLLYTPSLQNARDWLRYQVNAYDLLRDALTSELRRDECETVNYGDETGTHRRGHPMSSAQSCGCNHLRMLKGETESTSVVILFFFIVKVTVRYTDHDFRALARRSSLLEPTNAGELWHSSHDGYLLVCCCVHWHFPERRPGLQFPSLQSSPFTTQYLCFIHRFHGSYRLLYYSATDWNIIDLLSMALQAHRMSTECDDGLSLRVFKYLSAVCS